MQPQEGMEVGEIMDRYVENRRTEAKRVDSIIGALKPIRPVFAALKPHEITPDYVHAYMLKRIATPKKTGTPGFVSRRRVAIELAHLKAALYFALKRGWIKHLPPIEVPAGSKPRTRYLTNAEIRRLLEALAHEDTPQHLRLLVTLALTTGQRVGAIKALKWEHVDFERGIVWFSRTEDRASFNKRRQDVPMTGHLRTALARAAELADGPWVISHFGAPVTQTAKSWATLLKRADLKDVRLHDLRRTVATVALASGSTFSEVAALLNDDERIVRRHYAHVAPNLLQGVTGRLESAYALPGRSGGNETEQSDAKMAQDSNED